MSVWDANPRHIGVSVTVDASDVTPFVVGSITISRDGSKPFPSCDFTLFTPRMAFFANGSFSDSQKLVTVTCTCSAPGFSADTVTLFQGITEAPSNSGLYIPQGQIHAVSVLSRTVDSPGCILTQGFPDPAVTRVDLLAAFAVGALVPVVIDSSLLVASGNVTKPQDLQGISLLDLIAKWGQIDGWEIREKDGDLQLVPFTAIAGAGSTSVWDFTRDNFYHCAEQPPSRPVTKWVLGGNFTYIEPDTVPGTPTVTVTDAVDGTGTTRTTITTLDGAITELKIERIEDYTPLGVVLQTPLVATVVRRETVTNTYALSGGLPTAQLTDRVRIVEAWYATISSAGAGGIDVTFTDGSFHHGVAVETLQETERVTEAFTWDVIGSYVTEYTSERKGWLARPVETSDDGTHTDAGTVWPDGTTRIEAYEVYGVIERATAWEQLLPLGGIVHPPYSSGYANSNAYHPYRFRYQCVEIVRCNAAWTPDRITSRDDSWWRENAAGTKHQLRRVKWGIRSWYDAGTAGFFFEPLVNGPGSTDVTTDVDGPIPWPATTCPVARQFSMVPVSATFESLGRFDPKTESRFDEVFETAEEFERYARWRMRLGYADRITVSHPAQPAEIMREWDAVSVTDPARNLVAAPGWIEGIKWTLTPMTGQFDQVTQVALDCLTPLVPVCQ